MEQLIRKMCGMYVRMYIRMYVRTYACMYVCILVMCIIIPHIMASYDMNMYHSITHNYKIHHKHTCSKYMYNLLQ